MTQRQKARQRQLRHQDTIEAIQIGIGALICFTLFCAQVYFNS